MEIVHILIALSGTSYLYEWFP